MSATLSPKAPRRNTTMTRETVFKMDSKNHIRVWTIWVEHHSNKSIVFTRHGLNGASIENLAITRTEFVTTDHVDKSNSHVRGKIRLMTHRKGYTPNIPIARPFRPMLLQRWKDRVDSSPNNLFIQPKLRGFRCLASSSWLQSRTGDRYYLPHIQQALSHLPEDVVLDGELYCHGLSEQEISSRVKCPVNAHPEAHMISLFVFDIVEESLTYAERWEALKELFNEELPTTHTSTHQSDSSSSVPTHPLHTSHSAPQPALDAILAPPTLHPSAIEPHFITTPGVYLLNTLPVTKPEIQEHFDYYLSNGYEGAVIRNPYSHYQIDTRSPGVLKHKPIQTMNCRITNIVPGEKSHKHGKFMLQNPRIPRLSFPCQYKAPHWRKEYILKNASQFIGKYVQVEFEDFGEDDKPLKPIGVKIYE